MSIFLDAKRFYYRNDYKKKDKEINLNEQTQRKLIISTEDLYRGDLWYELARIKDIPAKKKRDAEEKKRQEERDKSIEDGVKALGDFISKLISKNPDFDKFKNIFETCFDEYESDKPKPSWKPSSKSSSDSYKPKSDYSKCPYTVLGVPKGSSLEVCVREFKKQALELHPDRNFGKSDEQKKKNLEILKLKSAALDLIKNMN